MGFFDDWLERRASQMSGPGPQHRPEPRALTAAGAPVNLRKPSANHTYRERWQTEAWSYRRQIPEFRYATDFVGNSLGRVEIFAAENRPKGETPVPLEAATRKQQSANETGVDQETLEAAAALVERLGVNQNGSSLFGRWAVNNEVAGECYLYGEKDGQGGEQWSIRSTSEMRIDQGGAHLRLNPENGLTAETLDPNQHDLYRLWTPDAEVYDRPDAPVSGLLGVLEGMSWILQRSRGHDKSRISAGKGLFLPQELLTLVGPAAVSGDLPGVIDDPQASAFLSTLIEYMHAAMSNPDDASAVVPLLLTGPATLDGVATKDLIGTFDLHGEDPKGLDERYEAYVLKFARGSNLAPERVKGLGDTNNWQANVITADEVKTSIEPRAEIGCDSFTAAYLYHNMRQMGITEQQLRKVCIWYNPGKLVMNPNRSQDAKDLFNMGEIGGEPLRRANGFTENDKPSMQERLLRALTQGELANASVPALLKLAAGQLPTVADLTAVEQAQARMNTPRPVVDATPNRTAPSAAKQVDATPPVGQREQPKTASQPGALGAAGGSVTAAAKSAPQWRLERRLGQDLARVDRELVTRILAHADATTGRAVERAAAKIRAAQGREKHRQATFPSGSDPRAVVAAAGRKITDLTEASLFEGALDDLETLWDNEVGHAATAVEALMDAALTPGRAQPTSMVAAGKVTGLADELRQRGKAAWGRLRDRLVEHAGKVLYGEYVPSRGGESSPGITPVAIVRDAVGDAGGGGGGLGTGDVALDRLRVSGALVVAHEWQYPMTARNHFLPHRRLDGVVFESWTDPQLKAGPGDEDWIVGGFYHPSDHEGCLCFTASICVVPLSESADGASDEVKALRAQATQSQ